MHAFSKFIQPSETVLENMDYYGKLTFVGIIWYVDNFSVDLVHVTIISTFVKSKTNIF